MIPVPTMLDFLISPSLRPGVAKQIPNETLPAICRSMKSAIVEYLKHKPANASIYWYRNLSINPRLEL